LVRKPTPDRGLTRRGALARASGRAAGLVSRRLGRGGGTTLPGVVARFVEPGVATGLAGRLPEGTIVVSGTNGKTTTTRLLSALLSASGRRVVHNRAGANLMSGVTTALLEGTGDAGLFEVDEATIPAALDELGPRLVLCLNLFRDQLDRYGELNTLAAKWAAALAALPPEAVALLNADDPLMANLGSSLRCQLMYFGLDSPAHQLDAMQHAADNLYCPRCSGLLTFDAVYYGHLGHYRCAGCGWKRPDPHFSARVVQLAVDAPTRFQLRAALSPQPDAEPPGLAAGTATAGQAMRPASSHIDLPTDAQPDGASPAPNAAPRVGGPAAAVALNAPVGNLPGSPGGKPTGPEGGGHPGPEGSGPAEVELCLETALPGLYNVYNVLAAAAAGLTLGIEPQTIAHTVQSFGGAFGRTELVNISGRRLRLLLAKNPVGYNEVIRTLLLDPAPLHLYLALNDRIADGQDVSWIWDVDFEQLAGRAATVLAGGDRAEDLAVRLKYAGLPPERIRLVKDHGQAVRDLLASTPEGTTGYAVPTYTAMLDLRRALAASGAVRQFWDD
jgi:UDP-N-acetylmuramyl tripeptide synthase